jgi:hypothetical protein
MSEHIRSQKEIYDGLMQRTSVALGVSVEEVGSSFHVLWTALASAIWPLDLRLSKVQQSIFTDLAERDELIREGLILLGRTPAAAVQGVYLVTVKNTSGVSIKAGTQFIANTDSTSPGKVYVNDVEYSTNGDVVNDILPLTNPTGTITLRALTSGIGGVLAIGDKLTAIQPLINATDEVVVASVITEARSEENIESYRADVIAAKAKILNILTQGTIRSLCLPVPDIRTVYSYAQKNNAGNIVVFVEATKENSLAGTYEPTQTVLDQLYKYDGINETGLLVYDEEQAKARRHIGVLNFAVLPITQRQVIVKLTGLTDLQKSEPIKNAISDLLYNIRPYQGGADSLQTQNDTLYQPQVLSAIYTVLNGTGVVFSTMIMSVDGVDVTEYRFTYGDYPYLVDLTNNGTSI